jgi:uncharacterized protein (TIGR02246 family)
MTNKKASPQTSLERRLQILEDKEAIRDVLSRYAQTVDLKRMDAFFDLFTPDGTLVTDGPGTVIRKQGKEEISAYLQPFLQKITQHIQVDYVIDVDGDNAKAVGYQLITETREGASRIARCALRQFLFRRIEGNWKIAEAISRDIAKTAECEKLILTGQ